MTQTTSRPLTTAELERALAEALERQTALADILRTIASAHGDLEKVFPSIAESAARYCGAEDAILGLVRDRWFDAVAHHGPIAAISGPVAAIDRTSLIGRTIMDVTVTHVPDVEDLPDADFAFSKTLARQQGYRSYVAAPLVKDGRPIGAISLRRREPVAFADEQIALLRVFADQAVIAIENVRLFNETKEALERQTATGEILRAISRSPHDVQPVLEAIAANAVRYCGVEDAFVYLVEDGKYSSRAHVGPIPALSDTREIPPIDRGWVMGRAILDRKTVHVPDLLEPDAAREFPRGHQFAVERGMRGALSTPLIRDGEVIGVIGLRRREPLPFTPVQLALVETFADQALIAIENVRLFNETKEALERQTAISEILRVISSSPTDVQPVLDAVVENALRFCAAEDAVVLLPTSDGTRLALAAHQGPVPIPPDLSYPLDGTSVNSRVFMDAAVVHRTDMQSPEAAREFPRGAEHARDAGYHAAVVAPLLLEGRAIGTISLRRFEPRPFTERQIDLLRTFADQAAIAIENVRLFNETKNGLDRQTAIADVMKVIGSSVSEAQVALDQVIAQATKLAEADNGFVYQREGDVLRMTAAFGEMAEGMREWQRSNPIRIGKRGASTGRAFLDKKTIHIPDVLQDPEYTYWDAQKLGGFRVLLSVPMIQDGEPLGVLAMWRLQPRPFTDAQIKVVELFADQAVVAVENARLFNETKEALSQQTATSDVLKVVGESTFNIQPVLDAVVQTAGRLGRADLAWVRLVEGDAYMRTERGAWAHWGATQELADTIDRATVPDPEETSPSPAELRELWSRSRSYMGLVWRERRTVHVDDISIRDDLRDSSIALRIGARTVLGVPLMRRQKEPRGMLIVARRRVAPFSDREIQLVETLADQASIAIENARLFHEIQDKSQQLEVASRHKSEFLANMSHELRTPLNAIIGFTDVMLEQMFGPLNEKQKEYLEDVRNSGNHLLTLINDILDLSKVEAGRVDLEIGEFSFPDALENALTLVRERATRHGITLASEVAPEVGKISADERKVKQILVNLLANAVKFTPDGGWVSVSAKRQNGEIEVAIHDTGIGVAPEDQERIFDEFQQVGRDPEKSREGTGLGLTLAKRFVELHGGRIRVESEVGKGSTFTFSIPVRQTSLAGARG